MSISIPAVPAPMKLIALGLMVWGSQSAAIPAYQKALAERTLEDLLDQAQKRGYRDSRKFVSMLRRGKATPKVIDGAQRVCLLLGWQAVGDAINEACALDARIFGERD